MIVVEGTCNYVVLVILQLNLICEQWNIHCLAGKRQRDYLEPGSTVYGPTMTTIEAFSSFLFVVKHSALDLTECIIDILTRLYINKVHCSRTRNIMHTFEFPIYRYKV